MLWLIAGDYRQHHSTAADVRLVIEVADSSLKGDPTEKAELYAEAEIVAYWIVDANASCVHVFRNPIQAKYTDLSIANRRETLSPLASAAAVLDVSDLFGGG